MILLQRKSTKALLLALALLPLALAIQTLFTSSKNESLVQEDFRLTSGMSGDRFENPRDVVGGGGEHSRNGFRGDLPKGAEKNGVARIDLGIDIDIDQDLVAENPAASQSQAADSHAQEVAR